MAEAEVTIQYRNVPTTLLYQVLVVSLPILIIFFVWSLLVLGFANASNPAVLSLIMGSELMVLVCTTVSVILLSDQTIFVTREGISLPFIVCPSKGTRTHINWSEISGVEFRQTAAKSLLLHFQNNRSVSLNLALIDPDQVEDLIMALDVWSGGGDAFPALLEARAHIRGDDDSSTATYTELWEDELARRFGATNFIPLEPGETINNKTLSVVRQIAFGGMSAIYLVENQSKESFVLKESVVPDDSNQQLKAKANDLFAKEAGFLAALSHPRIARIIDHFVEKERNYLLLEHLKGQDLRRLVKEFGEQSEKDVLEWALEIAELIAYLHNREIPIIHRDLTPDNLVLQEDGQVLLIDFGAANLFIGTATGTIIGKQAYIAPEQLRGKASLQSDLYSFGGTLHFLLTGSDPEPLCVSHPRDLNNKVSKEFDSLIAYCTEMELEDRAKSINEVEDRLRAFKRK